MCCGAVVVVVVPWLVWGEGRTMPLFDPPLGLLLLLLLYWCCFRGGGANEGREGRRNPSCLPGFFCLFLVRLITQAGSGCSRAGGSVNFGGFVLSMVGLFVVVVVAGVVVICGWDSTDMEEVFWF